MRIIFDASSNPSSRRIDSNGFLHVSACPISSHGVFDYARSEVGLPGDPNEIVKVLRPQEAISNELFIASCQNLPIIDDHTYIEGVVADSAEPDGLDPDKKGVCGSMTNVRYDEASGWVVADLAFYSRAMIRQILADEKTQLSLGYTCVFSPVESKPHAATQTDMTGNHLALVDRARVPGARVLDSAFSNLSQKDDTMSKQTKAKVKALDSSAVEKLRELLLPALQQFLTEESAEPEHNAEMSGDEPNTEEEQTVQDPEITADPEVEATAAEGEDEHLEGEGGGEAAITALLQQLLAALQPAAAAGDEKTEEELIEAGDEEGEERTAAAPASVSMDAVFQEVAKRDALYGRVSKVVGAFDCAAMTHGKVAEYGIKKLGLKAAAGQEIIVLDAYLGGVEATAAKAAQPKTVGDSAKSDELDAYLSGKK